MLALLTVLVAIKIESKIIAKAMIDSLVGLSPSVIIQLNIAPNKGIKSFQMNITDISTLGSCTSFNHIVVAPAVMNDKYIKSNSNGALPENTVNENSSVKKPIAVTIIAPIKI